MSDSFIGKSSPLSPAGLAAATALLKTGAAEIWSVLTVETKGLGFLPDRRPMILFERHIFHKQTAGRFDAHENISAPKPGSYAGGAAEYDRLAQAIALDRHAAFMSASWGIGQVMGFNFKAAGFANVEAMVAAMIDGEDAQLAAMAHFLNGTGLAASLAIRDWSAFAHGYNGPDYAKNQYDVKLRASYQHYNVLLPDLLVRQAQVLLMYLGRLSARDVDGVAGKLTVSAAGGPIDAALIAALRAKIV